MFEHSPKRLQCIRMPAFQAAPGESLARTWQESGGIVLEVIFSVTSKNLPTKQATPFYRRNYPVLVSNRRAK